MCARTVLSRLAARASVSVKLDNCFVVEAIS